MHEACRLFSGFGTLHLTMEQDLQGRLLTSSATLRRRCLNSPTPVKSLPSGTLWRSNTHQKMCTRRYVPDISNQGQRSIGRAIDYPSSGSSSAQVQRVSQTRGTTPLTFTPAIGSIANAASASQPPQASTAETTKMSTTQAGAANKWKGWRPGSNKSGR